MKRNKINWRVPKGMEITDLDRKVLYYQDRGHLVPTRELIKTPEQIEGIRRSGIINTGVLDLVEKEIHAGMSTLEIDKLVYDYTISHGGIPATLGYEGFPKSCCTSINEVVCHGIPNEFDILEEGDIINVDCTTIWMVIMPMPHVCLLLERLLLKRKISASGQRVLGNRHGSSQTFWIYRRYRSCDRETCQKMAFLLCVTSADMV